MNAVVCDRPGRFLQVRLPAPERPGPGEALIRIRRVGICGTDYHAFAGRQPFFTYPRILGHELAGTVEAVSPEKAEWPPDNPYDGESPGHAPLRPGDQIVVIPYLHCGRCVACRSGKTNCCAHLRVLGVHTDGGMRDLMTVPLSVLIRTDGLTLDQAAVMEPLAIGAHAVRRADVHPGENVLVIGAGPIGLGIMAFAKRRGARVIAMDLNRERLAFCRTWAGADETVLAGEGAAERVVSLTDGEGPTVVFDATGNARSMIDAFNDVAHGGRLVFVGVVKDDIVFSDPEFHRRELTLLASRNATLADFWTVRGALLDGSLDASRYISHRASRKEFLERWNEWQNPVSGVIKAMVEWD